MFYHSGMFRKPKQKVNKYAYFKQKPLQIFWNKLSTPTFRVVLEWEKKNELAVLLEFNIKRMTEKEQNRKKGK